MANQRKSGKKKIGFWATDAEKAAMLKAAKKAGFDNLADWLRSLITKGSGLLAVAFCLFHLTRSPRAWSAAALKATASAAWGHVQRIAR
jgi:hypothetical protein